MRNEFTKSIRFTQEEKERLDRVSDSTGIASATLAKLATMAIVEEHEREGLLLFPLRVLSAHQTLITTGGPPPVIKNGTEE
jgi:hypothetical protein